MSGWTFKHCMQTILTKLKTIKITQMSLYVALTCRRGCEQFLGGDTSVDFKVKVLICIFWGVDRKYLLSTVRQSYNSLLNYYPCFSFNNHIFSSICTLWVFLLLIKKILKHIIKDMTYFLLHLYFLNTLFTWF